MKNWIWIAALVTLIVGCSGKSSDTPALAAPSANGGGVATGGRHSTGGNSGTSMGGSGTVGGSTTTGGSFNQSTGGTSGLNTAGAAGQGLLTPTITIDSPAAAPDPDTGPVLLGSAVNVQVLCTATKSGAAGATDVAASSVKISLGSANGTPTVKQGAPVASQLNQYSASFVITSLPAGPVIIGCSATDQATPANSGSASITTFVDQGPLISGIVPVANAPFSLASSVHFEFNVQGQQLTSTDQGAQVGPVTLQVDGVNIAVQPDPTRANVYVNTTDVNFGDATKFPTVVSGKTPVVITASNRRSNPGAAVNTDSYYIVLDGDPPITSISSPAPNRIIGGPTQLVFSVTDTLSGVDPNTVVVNLGSAQSTPYPYTANDSAWTMAPGANGTVNFTFAFDSTKFDQTDSQISVSVIASDLAGNQSTSATILYYLDNVAPFVSLDPPNIRLETPTSNSNYYCSAPFDPLGPSVPDAGTIVNSFAFYRAFAWDWTNGKPSQSIFYYAGIDPSKVHLYVQPDPTKRVVYDKTGNGICNAIDDDVKQMPLEPNLNPINETGTANNNPPDYTTAPAEPNNGSACIKQGGNPPPYLCTQQSSDMTVVVHQVYAGQALNNAAIYGIDVAPNSLTCTGSDWDITSIVTTEGWICLAAEATDGVGNTGISAPIALCFDDENTPTHPACATGEAGTISTMTPPTCITDGCKPRSKSLAGDLDSSGNAIDLDLGNPIPFIITYRQ